jgi:hypothetical protein
MYLVPVQVVELALGVLQEAEEITVELDKDLILVAFSRIFHGSILFLTGSEHID